MKLRVTPEARFERGFRHRSAQTVSEQRQKVIEALAIPIVNQRDARLLVE